MSAALALTATLAAVCHLAVTGSPWLALAVLLCGSVIAEEINAKTRGGKP